MQPSATPGWQINLGWRQTIAAYWSISWPAWVALLAIVLVFAVLSSSDGLRGHLSVISLVETFSYYGIQAVLVHRLVRKDYRSFRVEVIRDDGERCRRLSMREAIRVWLWIMGPQLALLLSTSLALWWYAAELPPETVRSISSLSLWLRLLVVGPYAVDLALRVKYPGFRLQAYGYRYI